MLKPFHWSSKGEKLRPEDVAAQRQVVQAMMANRGAPRDVGEGLHDLGKGVYAFVAGNRANEAEREGRASADEAFTALMAGGDPMAASGNSWLMEDKGRAAVVQALLGQQFRESDPMYQAQLEQMNAPDWQTFNDPVTGDVMRWDAGDAASTPETFYDVPDKPPAFRPLTIEEKAAYGLAPDSPAQIGADGKVDLLGTGSQVTVNTGDANGGAFLKKADELAATRYDQIVAGGVDAAEFVGDLKALAEIGKQLNTGKGAELMAGLGPYAEFLGVDVEGLDEAQAYEAIIARMAPQMRVPGAGSSSDFDARQFLQSLPSLGKSPEGNAIISKTFMSIQEHKIAAAEIARRVNSGEISWQKGDEEIAALGDPFTAFNDYRAKGGPGVAAAEAGDVAAPTSDAEYNALPSGALFIDPDDGKQYRKP